MSRIDRVRALRAERVAAGLCTVCGKHDLVSKSLCQKCLDKLTERYRARAAAKQCLQCGVPTKGTRQCADCNHKRRLAAARKKQRREKGRTCNICGKSKPSAGLKTCRACRKRHKLFQEKHAAKCLAAGLCTICGKHPLIDKARCQSCADKHVTKRRSLRLRVIAAYGAICKCCGENDEAFLQVDHIDGGGRQHLKKIGNMFYRWLEIHKFPAGFQILCCNCNFAKARCGICPHERARQEANRRLRFPSE